MDLCWIRIEIDVFIFLVIFIYAYSLFDQVCYLYYSILLYIIFILNTWIKFALNNTDGEFILTWNKQR